MIKIERLVAPEPASYRVAQVVAARRNINKCWSARTSVQVLVGATHRDIDPLRRDVNGNRPNGMRKIPHH